MLIMHLRPKVVVLSRIYKPASQPRHAGSADLDAIALTLCPNPSRLSFVTGCGTRRVWSHLYTRRHFKCMRSNVGEKGADSADLAAGLSLEAR